MATHLLLWREFGVDAIHVEAAGLGVIEPHEEVDDRGLAASRWPDKSDLMALIDIEVEVLDDHPLAIVAEVHILGF